MSKLSIITVNLNNREGLRKTIESVVNQTFIDYEYIIIDGGSTDESIEVIKEYNDRISYWVSEPDSGIYHAMNKGINKAKGEYLIMLNSHDILYENDVLNKVVENGLDKDIVYGDILWVAEDKQYTTIFPDTPRFSYFLHSSLGHQAAFIRKGLHSIAGMYKEDYRIVSDWCFFIEAIFHYNCSFKHIPIIVSKCNRDGISCRPDSWQHIVKEREEFLKVEFPLFLNDYEDAELLKKEYINLKDLYEKEIKLSITNQIKRGIKRIPIILFIYRKLRQTYR